MLIYRNSFCEAGFLTGTVPININSLTVTVPIIKVMVTGMAPVNYSYLIAKKLKIVQRLTKKTAEYWCRNPGLTVQSYQMGIFHQFSEKC